jgi:hypothetical protein
MGLDSVRATFDVREDMLHELACSYEIAGARARQEGEARQVTGLEFTNRTRVPSTKTRAGRLHASGHHSSPKKGL